MCVRAVVAPETHTFLVSQVTLLIFAYRAYASNVPVLGSISRVWNNLNIVGEPSPPAACRRRRAYVEVVCGPHMLLGPLTLFGLQLRTCRSQTTGAAAR